MSFFSKALHKIITTLVAKTYASHRRNQKTPLEMILTYAHSLNLMIDSCQQHGPDHFPHILRMTTLYNISQQEKQPLFI
jgi:CTP:phosphocholine cytidylyltransferase-like protein